MVNRSSTPPFGLLVSGLPNWSKKKGKRTSRTGPVEVINDGIVLRAPSAVASVTCGFVLGLVPPAAGWAWHNAQPLELKRGPRPVPASMVPETESTSLNVSRASLKKARLPAGLLAATEARGPPAAAPARTPGSVWPKAIPAKNNKLRVKAKMGSFVLVIRVPPRFSLIFWGHLELSRTADH